MIKFYVDYENENYYDFEDYFDGFAIFGNRYYKEILPEWFKKAKELLSDIDGDCFHGESFSYYPNLTRKQKKDILAIYEGCTSIDDPDTITGVLNVLYPEKHFVSSCIYGNCQGDWQNIIYEDENGGEMDVVSDFYFGNVAEVHYEDEDGDTCWDFMSLTEIWTYQDDLKIRLLDRFNFSLDTECEVFESDGYTQVKKWKVA